MDSERAKLIAKIPEVGFTCKAECSACCRTPIQMLRSEWEALVRDPEVHAIFDSRQGHILIEEEEDVPVVRVVWSEQGCCPLLDLATNRCPVYAKRPLTCRIYGRSWLVWCREGVQCAPEGEVPDEVLQEIGCLMERPGSTPTSREFWMRVRAVVERWRAEAPGSRLDWMPSHKEARRVARELEQEKCRE